MKYISILTLLFLGDLLHSQQSDIKYVDSLNQVISHAKTSDKKVKAMTKLSWHWAYRDSMKALAILKEAEILAKDNNELKGTVILYRGMIYIESNPEKAKKTILEADDFLKDIKSKDGIDTRAKVWSNIATIEQHKGNEKGAVKILIEKAIPLIEKSGDKPKLGLYQSLIGMSLINFKEYKKAEEYLKAAIQTVEGQKEGEETRYWSKVNLAHLYLQIGKPTLAKPYLDDCAKILEKQPDSDRTPTYYRSLSEYHIQTKNNRGAMDAIEKGLRAARKLKMPVDIQFFNLQKFSVLILQNNLKEAENVMEEVLNQKETLTPLTHMESLQKMAKLQNDLGNHKKAYDYQKQYITELENYDKEENKQNVQELETKYNTTIKEQKLLTLESESKQQKIIFGISTIFLLGLASVLAYAFNQRKKRNKQELLIFEQNKKLEVSEAIIEGEEHERTRIARELHDGISGQLTGIKIQLENNKDTENNEKSATQIGSVLKELRQTARNLMPESLLQSGLEQALAEYCSNMQSENTQVSFYGSNLSKITDKNKQLNIFRIVQELFTNAVRHGKATNILVQAVLENGMLLIDVEDNGKGFETTTNKRNLGMNNIENRVKSLNGKVHWESQVGQGTNANIECKL